jgi:hypothetical protein
MAVKDFKIVQRKVAELVPAEYNPRKISEKQLNDLKKSFKNLGTLEPAVINMKAGRENIIISGHQRIRVATELGMETYPCIEVKFAEAKEREANIRMNKNTGEFDQDLLIEGFEIEALLEWGFEETELDLEIEEKKYSHKIESPIYKPIGKKPKITELYDRHKVKELVKRINNSTLPEEEKEFLVSAAQRHIIFNYENIANYYAHSPKEVQELMEDSALVIIDFNKAIENGFTRLTDKIIQQYKEDYHEK